MNEKELKKLNRKQLLELLLKQTERADELEKMLEDAQNKLQDKTIIQDHAGTMAEAALKLNGIFEAADAAASQYLKNIKEISKDKNLILERMEAKSRKKISIMLEETKLKCAEIERQSEKKVQILEKRAEELKAKIKDLESKGIE